MRNMRKRAFSAIFAILLVWSIALPAAAAYVPDEISPHAHDVEYKSELVSSSSWIKYPVGFAGGQPKNGTVFTNSGGFFWTDGGNNVSVDLTVSWGIVSANISSGSVASTGSTSQWTSAPTNTPCKLFIYKDIRCDRYAQYERLRGSTGPWNLVGYDEDVYTERVYLEVRYGNGFTAVWKE